MSNAVGNFPLPASYDESLINFVRLNSILYAKDRRMKPYETIKEKSEIRALWQSIATNLGVEPNFCLIRWKQLHEKYRRESLRQKQAKQQASPVIVDTMFLEKMRFVDGYGSHSHSHKLISHKSNDVLQPNIAPVSENVFGVINYEYLPEAMEAQSSTNIDTTTQTAPQMLTYGTPTNSVLTRIKALLDGLDALNRIKAEKRVLSYLCKCQLKALENESIDDVSL